MDAWSRVHKRLGFVLMHNADVQIPRHRCRRSELLGLVNAQILQSKSFNRHSLELHKPIKSQSLEADDKKSSHKSVIGGDIPGLRSKVIYIFASRTFFKEIMQHWWLQLLRIVDRIPFNQIGSITTSSCNFFRFCHGIEVFLELIKALGSTFTVI